MSKKAESAEQGVRRPGHATGLAPLGAHSDEAIGALYRPLLEALAPVVDSFLDRQQPVTQSLAEALGHVLQVSEEPIRAAFLARSLNALARLTPQLPVETLGDALGQQSDYAVLLHALEEPHALAVLQEQNPLAEACLRDLEMRETILRSEGGTITVEEVAKRLGITRQAVNKRRQAGQLLALPIGHHHYAYPIWQFGPIVVLPGFEDVLAALSLPDPWTQAAFFLSGNTYLDGQRPLDELRCGNVEPVCRAAWALGEQGAP